MATVGAAQRAIKGYEFGLKLPDAVRSALIAYLKAL